jgi:hypothetical protein
MPFSGKWTFCVWALNARTLKFLKITSMYFYVFRKMASKITEFWIKSLDPSSRKSPFFILGPFEGLLFLEVECSDSAHTYLGWIHSWVTNMNKIRPTSQALARRISIHASIHTYTYIRHSRNHFIVMGGGDEKVEILDYVDIDIFHHHSSFPYTVYCVYKKVESSLSLLLPSALFSSLSVSIRL